MAISLQPSTYRYDIDGLKGIAILAVVFYHVYVLTQSAHLIDLSFIESGFLGVDVFFVISGFLITASIYKSMYLEHSVLEHFIRHVIRESFLH